jgi:hypothetical protein
MDRILSSTGFIIILLGLFSMYTPWIQLKHSERLTGKELSKKHPEHEWMRWGFISMYLIWIVAVGFFFVIVLASINLASFIAAFCASIGLFIGLFALITGVSLFPMRGVRIWYVVGDKAVESGRFQVTLSVAVIIVAIALEILLR